MVIINRVSNSDEECLQLVQELITELSPNTGQENKLDFNKIRNDLSDNLMLFVAKIENEIIGLISLQVAYAFYANGQYGIINELYIKRNFRSRGIGKQLLDVVIKVGENKKWERIDVTAPPGGAWQKSSDFYKKNGFVFTGPKLKYLLSYK